MNPPLWLAALLVRSGLFIIAEGGVRFRWYESDQWWVIACEQRHWWFGERLLPFDDAYRLTRERVTGTRRR